MTTLAWVLLNPSTADADKEDPTIRRCMSYAREWGYGGIHVVNLFAWRTPDSRELLNVHDPVGPENDRIIKECLDLPLIVGWGDRGKFRNRSNEVMRLIGRAALCLGTTRRGEPRHPLYLPRHLTPMRYGTEGMSGPRAA